jgi:hypothetical protein
MPTAAAQLIADTALTALAAKHNSTVAIVTANLIAGNEALKAQFLELVEVGRRVAIVTAAGGDLALAI